MKCLRCGDEILDTEANDTMNYHNHQICVNCRTFMGKRLDYLIEADKKFHKIEKENFEVTTSYLYSIYVK